MPRRNRVDPWGDLHAVAGRGLLTGNRGCVVDDHERVVRHHGSSLWIACATKFRDWKWPLARPRRWTPLFFLDDTVALAAGHRPCATCRASDYAGYRDAVTRAVAAPAPLLASELNGRLHAERHRPGRGLERARDRIVWQAPYAGLPDGTVTVAAGGGCRLVLGDRLLRFTFDGWIDAAPRPPAGEAAVLTPPTSVAALATGYHPLLHASTRFRTAAPPDADRVRDLVRAAYARWVPVIGREPRPMTADYDRGVVEHVIDLYLEGGRPIALIEMVPETSGLLVENIAVHPEHQQRGLGDALLRRAETRARDLGFGELRLYTHAAFSSNLAFYARRGWVESRREPLPSGGELVHMTRSIAIP